MINHFRTVLLNLPGPRHSTSMVPSDIYIPEYKAVVLSGKLPIVDHVLFGDCLAEEDRIRKTYQLIRLVEASGLVERITEKDSRITYAHYAGGLECYEDTSSIEYSASMLDDLSETVLEELFEGDDLLFMYYNARTYVDRLAAVIVGYVRKLEGYENV